MAGWYRHLVSGSLAVAVAGLWMADRALLAQKGMRPSLRPAEVPEQVGTWRGKEIPLSPEQTAMLPRTDLLMRHYRRGTDPLGRTLELTVVTAGDASAFHNPNSCYRAGGWSVVRKERHAIAIEGQEKPLIAESLVVEKQRQRMLVLFWYALADGSQGLAEAHPSRLGVVMDTLRRGTGRPAAFFRVTALAVDGEDAALRRDMAFARTLMKTLRERRGEDKE